MVDADDLFLLILLLFFFRFDLTSLYAVVFSLNVESSLEYSALQATQRALDPEVAETAFNPVNCMR